MNGLGKLFVGNHSEFAGDVYTGFKNGRFEGLGIYLHANGDKYMAVTKMAIDTAKELISTKMVLNISEIIWRKSHRFWYF